MQRKVWAQDGWVDVSLTLLGAIRPHYMAASDVRSLVQKIRGDCSHPCTRTCGEKCGECAHLISVARPACGHLSTLTCAEVQSGSGTECNFAVDSRVLPCGHYQNVRCSAEGQCLPCTSPCGHVLNCGHDCTGLCSNCQASTGHSSCDEMCGKLQPCGHHCDAQ